MTDKMTITLEWGMAKENVNWDKAKEWCESLGDGWRMPTRGELMLAYEKKVGGFSFYHYWSSSEYSSYNAWVQNFNYGFQYYGNKNYYGQVRAVREVQG